MAGRGLALAAELDEVLSPPHEPRWGQVLTFRDLLRADQELARRYAEFKVALAREHCDDRERYPEAKHTFIEAVLERFGGI